MNRDISVGSRTASRGYPPTVGPSRSRTMGRPFGGSWMVPMITGALGMVTCLIANAAPCKRYPARSLCVDTTQGSFRKRADLRREKFPFWSRPIRKRASDRSARGRAPAQTAREPPVDLSFLGDAMVCQCLAALQSRREDQHSRCRTNARRQSLPHRKVSPHSGSKFSERNLFADIA